MIQFFDDIEKADQDAKLSMGNDFLEKLEIIEMNKIVRLIHENDIDSIIKTTQELERQHVIAKLYGDLDSSINGDFILD